MSHGNIINKDSIIEWDENQKLTWSDFLDKPDENDSVGDALTSYKIEIVPSNVVVDENDRIQNFRNLTVKANFYKYHSWYIENTDDLLEHEQLHFDIAELFARKMRKEFIKMQNDNESKFDIYSNCYSRLWKECRIMQQQYDYETSHGREKAMNQKWFDKIRSEINKLNEYR
ncbi:DUF922 domain-containing protein [Lutibacter maritimus]|uniref:DUF922 domain-containing protein n=1 Tax=Lutibacter maritimus TaxID=593133 RepID=A0A1I6SVY9_9FLAO|nr:DUF922 domain-containing protein [Lutibacter maritimus]SFS80998.1 protein of unknown function [Lutibacter maritimus]